MDEYRGQYKGETNKKVNIKWQCDLDIKDTFFSNSIFYQNLCYQVYSDCFKWNNIRSLKRENWNIFAKICP